VTRDTRDAIYTFFFNVRAYGKKPRNRVTCVTCVTVGWFEMKLLTPEAVSEQLSVSRSTVLRMIADKVIPAVCLRRGKRKAVYRIRQEVLDKWIIAKERQGTEAVGTNSKPGLNGDSEGQALDCETSALE
jgi:excisionase family DNA binding protein